ncbi:hypothetical protein [Streptomyces sp. NPDC048242]|uniref:hypothetical protein n=1 Tax=Streptomyces sp. NPDC048242 TaxID=3155026 RepID=UPI00342E97FD
MRRWPRRRPRTLPPPRANATTIAVLEHELFGIPPKPGTVAAVVIALRHAGTCATHQPVDMATMDAPQPVARCARCGATLALRDDGEWTVPAPS